MTQNAVQEECVEECTPSPQIADSGQAQQRRLTGVADSFSETECACNDVGAKKGLWRDETRRVLHLALPLSITNLSGFALGLVTVAFVGRLGQYELSVAVLATSIFNVTGLSVLIGFAAAMETFCGEAALGFALISCPLVQWFRAASLIGRQAYGAGSYHLVGVVLQRAIILTTLLVLGMAALWSQAGRLLLLLGQDPGISRGCAKYLHLAVPALYFTGIFEVLKRYLMVQGAVRPATAATLAALALSPLYNWLLVFKLGWGLDGAALAVDAVQATLALGLGVFIAIREFRRRGTPGSTWGGWSWGAFRGWRAYFTYALPSVAMICCEWWTFEAVIIMAGWLADPGLSVAVMGIAINISGVVYMLVTGLAMSCSVRVSTSLGAGLPHTARRATFAALALTSCLEAVAAAAVVAGRDHLPRLFTDIPAVVHLTQGLLPVFALSLPGDGVNAVLQGLLRGAGKQRLGAVTNVTSYWVIGVPLAAFFAFKLRYGVYGLWYGLVAVNTLQGMVMLVIALRFDFAKQAHRAGALFQPTPPPRAHLSRNPCLGGAGKDQIESGNNTNY